MHSYLPNTCILIYRNLALLFTDYISTSVYKEKQEINVEQLKKNNFTGN